METIPLEMDDIFDENDDDVIPTRLPDLDDLDLEENLQPMTDSRYEDNNDEAEGGEEPLTDNPELLAKLKSLKGASKNVQRRTYIKLDATRLTGERGIPILPKIFKNVKLKGKHHEAEDLKTIMHHLEHWGHRLFPKMPFSEVLDRTERLGAKKAVQTCVKRIRLGMPILANEFAEDEEGVRRGGDESDENDETRRGGNASDGNDEINGETTAVTNGSFSSQAPNDDEIDEFLSTAAELEREQTSNQSQMEAQTQPSQNQSNNTGKASLSEDAKARIERNKRLAMERRAARLAKANTEETNNPVPTSPSLLNVSETKGLSLKETEIDRSGDSGEQHSQDNSVEMSNDENIVSNDGTNVEKGSPASGDNNLLEDESEQMDFVSKNDQDKKREHLLTLKDDASKDVVSVEQDNLTVIKQGQTNDKEIDNMEDCHD